MDKNPALFSKTLVFGLIVLFIGVGIQSGIANEFFTNMETKEKTEYNRASDDYQEIITFIIGYGQINWIERRGIFRGEVETNQERQAILILGGLRLSNGGMEKYNLSGVGYVYATRFIGFSAMTILMEHGIFGVAFGNIEWELIE